MKHNKLLILISLLITCISCVERYYPDEDELMTGTLAVDAHLTDLQEEQVIHISRSAPLDRHHIQPETGCFVSISNLAGGSLEYTESGPGEYTVSDPAGFLMPGHTYSLTIVTENGEVYESCGETMIDSKGIDALYYELQTFYGQNEEDSLNGIRMYIDYEIDDEVFSFYRWELIETYEFRTPDYLGFIYGKDRILQPLPPELSDRQCWITNQIHEIFTQSTHNLSGEVYRHHPLNFISNEPQRLNHHYSLLVRQYSLTEGAYKYWNDLKNNSAASGIFDEQPALGQSNICSTENPDEQVIGYFSVSGVTEKRIFIQDVEGLELKEKIFCFPQFEMPRLYFIPTDNLPIYLSRAVWPYDGETYFGEVEHHCLDCREYDNSQGEPPEYWIE